MSTQNKHVKCPVWNCKTKVTPDTDSEYYHVSTHKQVDLITTILLYAQDKLREVIE